MRLRQCCCVLGLLFLLNLATSLIAAAHVAGESPRAGKASTPLSQVEAIERASQVEKVHYELHFRFRKGVPGYQGEAQIHADLARTDRPLRLDIATSRIKQITINGQPLAASELAAATTRNFLMIPAHMLSPKTQINVDYEKELSEGQNRGLFHFRDPLDQKEYYCSDSQPFDAHSFFPGFDQPDLKGTYAIRITAPSEWQTIANGRLLSREVRGAEATSQFETLPPFSTYLVFVGAGEFAKVSKAGASLPQTIYTRQSLANFLDAEEIFSITTRGLEFFASYFSVPYPFTKYDHIFCPNFGPGAMENPGAVTMNERMIFRGPVAQVAAQSRANTILHEAAHMWFGDLVTMRWWDDLWLNESFATYMAHLAQDRAFGEAGSTWTSFVGQKGWALYQDSLPTTHPIAGYVPDTNASETIFNGITYAKGAATLQQLHFMVGDTAFRQGLKNYFERFAWSNTDRHDFVRELASAAGQPLEAWARDWLESSGPSRISTELNCANGLIQELRVHQEATASGTLLSHHLNIALFSGESETVEPSKVIRARIAGATTIIEEARGEACPSLIFPNWLDQTYAEFPLDNRSRDYIRKNFSSFSLALARAQLWHLLLGEVEGLRLRTSEFLRFASFALLREEDQAVLGQWVGRYSTLRDLYWSVLTPNERGAMAALLEDTAWLRLKNSMDGKGGGATEAVLWLNHFALIAHSGDSSRRLGQLLDQTEFMIPQPQRWTLLTQLARLGEASVANRVAQELARDNSADAAQSAYAARVSEPTLAAKQRAWHELTSPDSTIPFSQRRAGASFFHNADLPFQMASFVEPFFSLIETLPSNTSGYLVRGYFDSLFPGVLCSPNLLAESEARLRALNPAAKLAKPWLEANEDLRRCVAKRHFNMDAAH